MLEFTDSVARYVTTWTARSTPIGAMFRGWMDWARDAYPKEPADSDFVYKQTIKAKACDAVRGVLPAATLSNVGIYGTGQSYEALLLRMRAHPLPEARTYARDDARRAPQGDPVVPHACRPARAGRPWTAYLAETRDDTARLVAGIFGDEAPEPAPDGDAPRLRPRR